MSYPLSPVKFDFFPAVKLKTITLLLPILISLTMAEANSESWALIGLFGADFFSQLEQNPDNPKFLSIDSGVNPGVNVGLELDWNYSNTCNFTVGFQGQIPRSIHSESSTFYFTPLYGSVRLRLIEPDRHGFRYLASMGADHVDLVLKLGYGFFSGTDHFRAGADLSGDRYGGLGFIWHHQNMQIQLSYNRCTGQAEWLDDTNDIKYNKFDLNVGYNLRKLF